MKSIEFLDNAKQHQQRGAQKYDQPQGERSMKTTVDAFNAYTGKNLSEKEGWLFMECLKTARSLRNNGQPDDIEDLASYVSLRGECMFPDEPEDSNGGVYEK